MADWALRRVADDLAQRYRAEGWWDDSTLGSMVAEGLGKRGTEQFHVHSKVRPWSGAMVDVDRAARSFAAHLLANGFRGTPEGAAYFRDLVEEMTFKAANGIGTVTEEKHRLVFVGVPCYPIFRRFNELFSEWGGAFVSSTYLWFASGGAGLGWQYDLSTGKCLTADRPIRVRPASR